MQEIFEFVTYLLAVYGAIILIFSCLHAIGLRAAAGNAVVKVVILVRNAEEQSEEVVRNAVRWSLTRKLLANRPLAVVDMGSGDGTAGILEKLKKDYPAIQFLSVENVNGRLTELEELEDPEDTKCNPRNLKGTH